LQSNRRHWVYGHFLSLRGEAAPFQPSRRIGEPGDAKDQGVPHISQRSLPGDVEDAEIDLGVEE
jgi:hypothetical protein